MMAAATRHNRWSRIDAAGVALCIAVSVAWYAITIRPLIEQRSRTADLRRQIQDQQRKDSQLRTSTAAAQQQLQIVRQELQTSGIRLDSAAHINTRIARLTEFFADCTLHIDDVQTGRVCNGRQCDLVPITIVGRGGYPQCIRFLHELCSTFPDMSATRVEFRATPGPTPQAEQFRFEMLWYAAPAGPAHDDGFQENQGEVAFNSWSAAR
ncbi:MAG: hypothetical protein ACM3VT_10970 [Solirubrobacterales bacterium]